MNFSLCSFKFMGKFFWNHGVSQVKIWLLQQKEELDSVLNRNEPFSFFFLFHSNLDKFKSYIYMCNYHELLILLCFNYHFKYMCWMVLFMLQIFLTQQPHQCLILSGINSSPLLTSDYPLVLSLFSGWCLNIFEKARYGADYFINSFKNLRYAFG